MQEKENQSQLILPTRNTNQKRFPNTVRLRIASTFHPAGNGTESTDPMALKWNISRNWRGRVGERIWITSTV